MAAIIVFILSCTTRCIAQFSPFLFVFARFCWSSIILNVIVFVTYLYFAQLYPIWLVGFGRLNLVAKLTNYHARIGLKLSVKAPLLW